MFIFLSFIITLIETIGIFSIVPFIAIASNPALISTGYYMKVYNIFGFTSIPSFLISFGFILTGFFILRGIYSILHSYLLNSYVFGIFRSISLRLFQNYINMPYSDFANRNSAELTKSITAEAMYFSFILQYLLFFFIGYNDISLFLYRTVACKHKSNISLNSSFGRQSICAYKNNF